MGCYEIRGVSEWGLLGEGRCFKSVSCFLSLALEQLLTELDDFLRILDQENLSSTCGEEEVAWPSPLVHQGAAVSVVGPW